MLDLVHSDICGPISVTSITRSLYFVVNTLSQFMVEPRQVHWVVVKHVLRYLRGTVDFGLRYVRAGGVELKGIQILIGQGVWWT